VVEMACTMHHCRCQSLSLCHCRSLSLSLSLPPFSPLYYPSPPRLSLCLARSNHVVRPHRFCVPCVPCVACHVCHVCHVCAGEYSCVASIGKQIMSTKGSAPALTFGASRSDPKADGGGRVGQFTSRHRSRPPPRRCCCHGAVCSADMSRAGVCSVLWCVAVSSPLFLFLCVCLFSSGSCFLFVCLGLCLLPSGVLSCTNVAGPGSYKIADSMGKQVVSTLRSNPKISISGRTQFGSPYNF
jgi:hypothetical protein